MDACRSARARGKIGEFCIIAYPVGWLVYVGTIMKVKHLDLASGQTSWQLDYDIGMHSGGSGGVPCKKCLQFPQRK